MGGRFVAVPKPSVSYEKGAQVAVLEGKHAGKMDTIEKVNSSTVRLRDTPGNIPFKQFIVKGDEVKSVRGTHEGKVGIISSITPRRVRLNIKGVETGDVPWESIEKVEK